MRQWFQFPITEGDASRQAHCDLPEGTFERECGGKVSLALPATCTTVTLPQVG